MSSVLIFGEVLFDCFEDGSQVLGGAPFNVAWHLNGLGVQAQLISRVGNDALGNDILAAMQDWGMDVSTLQRDTAHATGRVNVMLSDGIPDFDIVTDSAYDYIQMPDLSKLAQGKCLYHGSLALRAPQSRETLQQLRQNTGLPVFIDINLRRPHWDRDYVLSILDGASWVKLNHEELLELSTINSSDLDECALAFQARYGLEALIVTRGEKGAFIQTTAGRVSRPPCPVTQMVDTVGAGDAFSAMTLCGILHGWPYEKILDEASAFASRVCGLRGAVTREREFYNQVLEELG